MNKFVAIAMMAFVAVPALAGFDGGTFRYYVGGDYVELEAVAQTRLSYYPGHSNGGAFWVDSRNAGNSSLSGLPGYGFGDDLFTTFCVEETVTFHPNRWYWASVDTNAYSGAGGGGINGDPVSDVTEAIYDAWLGRSAALDLSGYSQHAISRAIWYAEKELGSISGDAKALYDAASITVHGSVLSANDLGVADHTRALNLWTVNEVNGEFVATDRQSQLISVVPVPGAALLGVLGLGLVSRIKRSVG